MTSTQIGGAAGGSLQHRRRPVELLIKIVLVLAAVVSIVTTIAIVLSFVQPTRDFFQQVSIIDFFTDTVWSPTFSDKHYGILALLVPTVLTMVIAIAIAVPLGLGAAIYLAEYASDRARRTLKPILEVLAGVPTVVYGYFAITALNPIVKSLFPNAEPTNLLIAGVAMGFMIIPTVASLSEDAMSAVPRSLREGAFALASSKMQVATKIVVPAAISGIIASFVLGISRAVGETMIVTVAGGLQSSSITADVTQGRATMTAYIANIARGDIPVDSFDYRTLFVVGAVLFLFTFILNAISIRMVRKFREVYE